ncbi:MAG TPA: hypothetical protein VLA24_17450 [Pseudomonadales bacterium]|nr:hypothetical protein [Pseudomonadales bacterium]
MIPIDAFNTDPHLYASSAYPLLTIYDDNLFVRNDYDVLTPGQRRYIVEFAQKFGFKQTRGTQMTGPLGTLMLPRPASSLACSVFKQDYLTPSNKVWHAVTATGYAETIFYDMPNIGSDEGIIRIKALIEKCPFNIEWLRDISYGSPIAKSTAYFYDELVAYQKMVIDEKFKKKRRVK